MHVPNGLWREACREAVVEHLLHVLRGQRVELDGAESRRDVVPYVPLIPRMCQRSQARLDRLSQPVLEELSERRDALDPKVLLMHLELERKQLFADVTFACAVDDPPSVARAEGAAPYPVGAPPVDAPFAEVRPSQAPMPRSDRDDVRGRLLSYPRLGGFSAATNASPDSDQGI